MQVVIFPFEKSHFSEETELLNGLAQVTQLLRELENKNPGPPTPNLVSISHPCIVLIFIWGKKTPQMGLLNTTMELLYEEVSKKLEEKRMTSRET